MKLFSNIPSFLKNKYFITSTCFIVWLVFFDHNDLFTQMERRRELRQIEASKEYFSKQIAQGKKLSNDLKYNASVIEKYAREKYLMKKDNEDLFLIRNAENK
jgi:cell division protein DivIC